MNCTDSQRSAHSQPELHSSSDRSNSFRHNVHLCPAEADKASTYPTETYSCLRSTVEQQAALSNSQFFAGDLQDRKQAIYQAVSNALTVGSDSETLADSTVDWSCQDDVVVTRVDDQSKRVEVLASEEGGSDELVEIDLGKALVLDGEVSESEMESELISSVTGIEIVPALSNMPIEEDVEALMMDPFMLMESSSALGNSHYFCNSMTGSLSKNRKVTFSGVEVFDKKDGRVVKVEIGDHDLIQSKNYSLRQTAPTRSRYGSDNLEHMARTAVGMALSDLNESVYESRFNQIAL